MHFEHLYVHVPFCARRCVYCDFSIAVRSEIPTGEFTDAVASELRLRHSGSSLDLETVYFGGGTPSKLGGEGIARLLEVIRTHAHIRKGAEVTLEANPEDVSAEAVARWSAAGITRVSLGVQSFDDRVLSWMHRTHDARTAIGAVQALRAGGIVNISIDLIFAVPEDLGRSWRTDLETTLQLGLPHVSLYGLTVESHTPLGRWVERRTIEEAPERCYEVEFLDAERLLGEAGYEHYEVSNYGKPGCHSRHNWAYWERRPYVGVGPSAHEFDGRTRRWNVSAYTAWLGQLRASSDPIAGSEALSDEQVEQESVYLGLRTSNGVSVQPAGNPRLSRWVAAGWGALTPDTRLRLNAAGWLRLDSIASDLTAFRSRY